MKIKQWGSYSILALGTGVVLSLYNHFIHWNEIWRYQWPWLTLLLPIAGLIVLRLHGTLQEKAKSYNANQWLLWQSYHSEEVQRVNFRHLVVIFLEMVVGNLFGAPTGREDIAAQMTGTIVSMVNNKCHVNHLKLMSQAAMGAAFAGTFGTPFAGCIFAVELTHRRLSFYEGITITWTVWITYLVVKLLGTPYPRFHVDVQIQHWTLLFVIKLIAVAILCVILAVVFKTGLFILRWIIRRLNWSKVATMLILSVSILLCAYMTNVHYLGISLWMEQAALDGDLASSAWLVKMVMMWLSVVAGFQGGLITPLFEISMSFGHYLAQWIHITPAMLVILMLGGTITAITRLPMTWWLFVLEWFGLFYLPELSVVIMVVMILTQHRSGLFHLSEKELRKGVEG